MLLILPLHDFLSKLLVSSWIMLGSIGIMMEEEFDLKTVGDLSKF